MVTRGNFHSRNISGAIAMMIGYSLRQASRLSFQRAAINFTSSMRRPNEDALGSTDACSLGVLSSSSSKQPKSTRSWNVYLDRREGQGRGGGGGGGGGGGAYVSLDS